jgi:hypothetical protein
VSFIKIVDQVIALLKQRERVSYRVLKREFALDDEAIADVKDELRGEGAVGESRVGWVMTHPTILDPKSYAMSCGAPGSGQVPPFSRPSARIRRP